MNFERKPMIQWLATDVCATREPAAPAKLELDLRQATENLDSLEKEYVRLRHVDTHPTLMAGLHGPSGYFSFSVPKTMVIQAMEKEIAVLKTRIAKLSKASKTIHGIASRAIA